MLSLPYRLGAYSTHSHGKHSYRLYKGIASKSNNQLCSSYALGQQRNREPLIQVIDNLLSETEIKQLVDAGAAGLTPAKVSGAQAGIMSKGRSGRNVWLPHASNNDTLGLCERLSSLVQLPLPQAESLQLIHYDVSQEYAPHFDA